MTPSRNHPLTVVSGNNLDPAKVLVTGGAGFIGSHLVDHLIDADYDVVVVDSLANGTRRNVASTARFYQLDIRERRLAEVFSRERPAAVCHLAVQARPDGRPSKRTGRAEANVVASLKLLECAATHGVRKLVYTSTANNLYQHTHEQPTDEQQPVRPLTPHAVSKYAVEHFIRAYAHLHSIDFSILRCATVYGPRQQPSGEDGIVASMATTMLHDQTCTIPGDGEQMHDLLAVEDCVRLIAKVLDGDGESRTYNVGSGQTTSVNHLFEALAQHAGYLKPAVYRPAEPDGRVLPTGLDTTRSRQELDWCPRISLNDGLARTVAHYRAAFESGRHYR